MVLHGARNYRLRRLPRLRDRTEPQTWPQLWISIGRARTMAPFYAPWEPRHQSRARCLFILFSEVAKIPDWFIRDFDDGSSPPPFFSFLLGSGFLGGGGRWVFSWECGLRHVRIRWHSFLDEGFGVFWGWRGKVGYLGKKWNQFL